VEGGESLEIDREFSARLATMERKIPFLSFVRIVYSQEVLTAKSKGEELIICLKTVVINCQAILT
jgi:hypothetical protein